MFHGSYVLCSVAHTCYVPWLIRVMFRGSYVLCSVAHTCYVPWLTLVINYPSLLEPHTTVAQQISATSITPYFSCFVFHHHHHHYRLINQIRQNAPKLSLPQQGYDNIRLKIVQQKRHRGWNERAE